MPPSAVCRIKKDFCGLVLKTGLTGLMVILLRFSEIHPMILVALAAILFIVCMKIPMAYYGREQKMDCTDMMPLQKVLLF